MLEDKKNIQKNLKSHIKDTSSTPAPYEAEGLHLGFYSKTNKLVSALYMVTDIMDKEEPLRNKLRNLGTNIVSDIYSLSRTPLDKHNKISEILSFLEIASSVSIISEMNCSILSKEFIELRKSIIETAPKNEQVWLQEFISEGFPLPLNKGEVGRGFLNSPHPDPLLNKERGNSKGHTSIGVQRGDTLLKALSDRIPSLNKSKLNHNRDLSADRQGIDVLKNKRREEIVSIIKDKMKDSTNFDGIGIKDIVLALRSLGEDRGEKTLQRELVSMVLGNVLKKTGEKRWSRYSLN